MAGPLPPAVGGMASVIGGLMQSPLSSWYALHAFDTSPRATQGRSVISVLVRRLSIWRDWWRALQSSGADVAHIHTCSGVSFFLDGALLLLARLRGVVVILHIHGGRFDTFLDGLVFPLRALARWIARRAGRVIVLSQTWITALAPRLPGAHLVVVENGVAIPSEPWRSDAAAATIMFLGNLDTNKGVFDLVRAAAQLESGTELVLAGPEGETGITQRLRTTAKEVGVDGRLVLPGAVQGESKERLFARAMMFVLPSYFEGLPVSLLEAMARGIPVIATSVGAVPTAVHNEQSGLLIAAGDIAALAAAMRRLQTDADLRQRLGAAGRTVCRQRFSVERSARVVAGLYEELCGSAQRLVA